MGAPTSPSQTPTSRGNGLDHESRDLLDSSNKKSGEWKSSRKTFEKGKTNPARPPDVSTNPDKSRVSRSQDTTDELSVQEPDRNHPDCSGLVPHHALFWTNTHEE